ncbi:unnamed protein product [Peniophora sp. CBMAI 1063]|nr:unnamed protein product [Peniophora sp. CBMAI 1063]
MDTMLNGFHHARPPYHMHMTCNALDCEKRENLSRCRRCNIGQYCSKECQLKDWSLHKLACQDWRVPHDYAVKASGNPNAWADFAAWSDYHHNNLANAALAHCASKGRDSAEDVLCLFLAYKGQHSCPIERIFAVESARFAPRNDSDIRIRIAIHKVLQTREANFRAMHDRRITDGLETEPEWTRTCIFFLSFDPKADRCLYAVHYTFASEQLDASVLPIPPTRILTELLQEGRRVKVCCRKNLGMPPALCCCGGWTHDDVTKEQVLLLTLQGDNEASSDRPDSTELSAAQGGDDGTEEQASHRSRSKKKKPKKKKPKGPSPVVPKTSDTAMSSVRKDVDETPSDTEGDVHSTPDPPTMDLPQDVPEPAADAPVDVDVGGKLLPPEGGSSSDAPIHAKDPEPIISQPEARTFKYDAQVHTLRELFPSWSYDDLKNVLVETRGDVKLAAQQIGDGTVQQWVPVKSKKEKRREKQSLLSSARLDIRTPTATRGTPPPPINMETVEVPTEPPAMKETYRAEDTEPTPQGHIQPAPPIAPQGEMESEPLTATPSSRVSETEALPLSERERTLSPVPSSPLEPSPPLEPAEIQLIQNVVQEHDSELEETIAAALDKPIAQHDEPELSFPTIGFLPPDQAVYFPTEVFDSEAASSHEATPQFESVPPQEPAHQEPVISEPTPQRYRIPARRQPTDASSPQSNQTHPPTTEPPPGLDAPRAHEAHSHTNPYGAHIHPNYAAYVAAYNAYAGAYGATTNSDAGVVDPERAPFVPPIYAQPMVTMPTDSGATRALEAATRELMEATRVLREAAQRYHLVEAAGTAPTGSTIVSPDVEISEQSSLRDTSTEVDESCPPSSPVPRRGRLRRASAVDIGVGVDRAAVTEPEEEKRARSLQNPRLKRQYQE